jgi:phthiocerol/phenolphthiocerol synthesis type-I polyketide synthase C
VNQDPAQLVAVIGMAGRFPGAPDIQSFWRLLIERADPVSLVPSDRWDATQELDPVKQVPDHAGFIDNVDQFDPAFFQISPREAEDIDPQQRLMLEVAWQALEDAGQRASALARSRTGVYVGATWHDYEQLRRDAGALPTQYSLMGNSLDVIAGRISYFLRLTGPSLVVATGCSSALVGLHLAAQALRGGEVDAALVGGVNLMLTPDVTIETTHFGGLSPDGRSKAFAASANGYGRGEGVAALFLKRLDKALADGDRVHGVIVGTAVNNDGGGDSLATPSPAGQRDLLEQVYAADVERLRRLAYVEAHGTGTSRGDPIEATALGQVLGQPRDPAAGPLWIGSVKTNIGHLEPASGLAGLIKVLLSLRHGVVPASRHAEELNPAIPFEELNLRVAREPLRLPRNGPVYLGVNSFGWGGTNAHAVVTAPPPLPDAADATGTRLPLLVPLSARSDEALRQRAADLSAALTPEEPLTALAGTLAWRRDHFPSRACFVVSETGQLRDRLTEFAAAAPDEAIPGGVTGRARPRGQVAFVFPGQGSQWAGMGQALYAAGGSFAASIDRCSRALAREADWRLADIFAGRAGDGWLSRVDVVQPALWAMSVSLAGLWREAGIEPDVVIGHSQGEVAAATVAGILSLEDAALVVARRSALLRRVAGRGLMLAVEIAPDKLTEALTGFEDSVSVAVTNSPTSCVLSGDAEAVSMLKELLEAEGTFCRLVKVDYASHSPQMDEIAAELTAALEPVRPAAGRCPMMSTTLPGRVAGPELDGPYWVSNLRKPVLFADAMGRLLDEGVTHAIEMSAHPVLVPAIEQLAAARAEPASVLWTLSREASEPADLALAYARGYVRGLEPFGGLPRAAAAELPPYPWERRRHWVGRRPSRGSTAGLRPDLVPDVTEQGSWQWALELGTDGQPWLADHRVKDGIVLPATAMMGLALAAAHSRGMPFPQSFAGFRFLRSLPLGAEPTRLSVRWREDAVDGARYTLLSLAPTAAEWAEHATAHLERGPSAIRPRQLAEAEPAFPAALRDARALDVEEFYRQWEARGLTYGPAFQGLTSLFTVGAEALGEVALPAQCRAASWPHGPHPALWDAALQVALALCDIDGAVMPTAVRRVVVLREPAEPVRAVWSHAIRTSESTYDVRLFDGAEEPLIVIEGVTLTALETSRPGADDVARLHQLDFREQPLGAQGAGDQPWIVCGAADDGARALADALAAAGAPVAWIEAGDPDEARLRAAWGKAREAAGREPAGVAFVAPRAASGLAAQRQGLIALTYLARMALAQPAPPRVAVLTAGAQGAVPADEPDPGAALYWGYCRVLRREHGELRTAVIDVAPGDGEWPQAAAELLAGDEDQVALRGTRRLVGRLVRGEPPAAGEPRPAWGTPAQPFVLRTDRPGHWDGLVYHPLVRRRPGPGEVEVEVTATALNYLDVLKAMGAFPAQVKARGAAGGVAGAALGLEFAGRVSAVGPGVPGLAAGDRVMGCAPGTFASHVIACAGHVRRIPDGLGDRDAVTLPIAASTAWYALNDVARLSAGETVLIHSAAGGLGLAAVQCAAVLGAKVIATVGSARKREYLQSLGVTEIFSSRDMSWPAAIREATGGRGVDVVLNSLSGAAIDHGLDLLAEDGRFIEAGKKDIFNGRRISMDVLKKSVSIAGVDLEGLIIRRRERFARLFADVCDLIAAGKLTPLPATWHTFSEVGEAFRTMALGTHIGKLGFAEPGSVRGVKPVPMPGGRFRGDATYLITGGLGALGLSLAEFLVDHGAGAVALLGRSAPSAEAAERIAAMTRAGARIATHAVDVADKAALLRALAHIRADLPPLRGVFHAAGLLDDATIATLQPGQLERVLAPKVDGARNLDEATAGDPLDLFVLFSSAAALIGNAGQAAYAAGNAYLDSLAVARRRRGHPALSVQWGPFSDVGLAAQDSIRGARLEGYGLGGLTTHDAWPALARCLDRDAAVIGYLELNVRHWLEAYPDTSAQPSWALLREAAEGGGFRGGADRGFLAQLSTAPDGTRRTLVEAKVRELAGRVLRLSPDVIESAASFNMLGLDSMLGLELRNLLEAAFGLKLPPTLVWAHANCLSVADELSGKLDTAGSQPTAAAVPEGV